jgi:nitroreductase
MKKIIMCCVLLAGGVWFLSAQEGAGVSDTLKVIHQRKSVRHFTGAQVSKADLETIVRAGMAAPTAVNMQPWSFVIVSERKKLDELAAVLPYAKMLGKAGAAIIVCAEPKKAFEQKEEFAVIDASLASENILLAIEALGLGGLWTAAYPDSERVKAVRDLLKIPNDIIPLNVIPVGVPTGEDKPKDKYKKEKIHWEKW